MLIEFIILAIFVVSLAGILFILARKIPVLNTLPQNGTVGIRNHHYIIEIEQKIEKLGAKIQNRKYCVSFYVNFTNPIFTYNNVAITEIGMYISDTVVSLLPSDESTLPYSPQIKSPSGLFLNDTLDWVEISGTYTAHGGEKYITIGNFNSNTDTIGFVNRNNYSASYYFIDDVSVVDCTDMGVPQLTDAKDFKLYPNPNDGNMTLEYSIDGKESGLFTIYDVSGRLVKQQSLNPENNLAIITAEELSAGAYYYTVTIADRKVKSDKLIIIK